MRPHLNHWQHLWLVISIVVFILMAFTLAFAAWPNRDPQVVADLTTPTCKGWIDLPNGFYPERHPATGDACFALQAFLFDNQTNIKTPADYDRYLNGARTRTLGMWFLYWVATIFWLYLIGWATGWVARGLVKPPANQP